MSFDFTARWRCARRGRGRSPQRPSPGTRCQRRGGEEFSHTHLLRHRRNRRYDGGSRRMLPVLPQVSL
jgi:hypothetical protein